MENKTRFFDEIFKVLVFITLSAWAIYILFLLFVGNGAGCVAGPPRAFFSGLALVAGVLSAPPLVYGVLRLLFWPNGPKLKGTWAAGLIIGGTVSVFIATVITFAVAVSEFGC